MCTASPHVPERQIVLPQHHPVRAPAAARQDDARVQKRVSVRCDRRAQLASILGNQHMPQRALPGRQGRLHDVMMLRMGN